MPLVRLSILNWLEVNLMLTDDKLSTISETEKRTAEHAAMLRKDELYVSVS